MTPSKSASNMRVAFVASLLAMLAVAGCFSDSDSGSDSDQPTPVTKENYVVPDVPAMDAVVLLEDHAKFVRENPNRQGNTADHESARLAMMDMLASWGLETYRHNFTAGIPQANIMGIKWGAVRDQWVVVGAHYDIVNTPPCPPTHPNGCSTETQGAYDDGSGTMMTMHLAKAFSNVTPYYTMAFVAYDGEERGLQGAGAFVRDFMVEPIDEEGNDKTPYGQIDIVGALDLDMLGLNWPGVMAPFNILDNSENLYQVANAKRLDMEWPDEQWKPKDGLALGSSDYARFWSVDEDSGGPIPTMFFIADFEELGVPMIGGVTPAQAHTPAGAYPFWHLEDTVETMTGMAGGEANLIAGFQAAADVAVVVMHAMACQPALDFSDAVVR